MMASLSASINAKIIDVKISTSCLQTVPGSTLYLAWRQEFHTEQWPSFLITDMHRDRNVNAQPQPEFITECTETMRMP